MAAIKRRAVGGGTENVAAIIGLGKAAEMAKRHLDANGYDRIGALRDKLERTLLERVPNSILNGDPNHRLPNTTSIAFEYVEGDFTFLEKSDGLLNLTLAE